MFWRNWTSVMLRLLLTVLAIGIANAENYTNAQGRGNLQYSQRASFPPTSQSQSQSDSINRRPGCDPNSKDYSDCIYRSRQNPTVTNYYSPSELRERSDYYTNAQYDTYNPYSSNYYEAGNDQRRNYNGQQSNSKNVIAISAYNSPRSQQYYQSNSNSVHRYPSRNYNTNRHNNNYRFSESRPQHGMDSSVPISPFQTYEDSSFLNQTFNYNQPEGIATTLNMVINANPGTIVNPISASERIDQNSDDAMTVTITKTKADGYPEQQQQHYQVVDHIFNDGVLQPPQHNNTYHDNPSSSSGGNISPHHSQTHSGSEQTSFVQQPAITSYSPPGYQHDAVVIASAPNGDHFDPSVHAAVADPTDLSNIHNDILSDPNVHEDWEQPLKYKHVGTGVTNTFGNLEVGGKTSWVFVGLALLWYLVFTTQYKDQVMHPAVPHICDEPSADFAVWNYEARPPRFPHMKIDPQMQTLFLEMFNGGGKDDSSKSDEYELPDMTGITDKCSKDAFFYGMSRTHMEAVNELKNMFMEQEGAEEVYEMAKALRDSSKMNPKVWYEALMGASVAMPSMGGYSMASPLDAMPDTFIHGAILSAGRGRQNKRGCMIVDGSIGEDNGPDNALWYFREDLMVNSHHWYWHLTHPLRTKAHPDRRGELFYFSHHSMLARYNAERLCNGFARATNFKWRLGAPIPEGYNSHLHDMNSGMEWTVRLPYTPIQDTLHGFNPDSGFDVYIDESLRTRTRLYESISHGSLISPHGPVYLPHFEGIDQFANTFEATELSINPEYYNANGLHNNGHVVISFASDPLYEKMLPPGVMGDPATAMRDPIFYRWHTFVDDVFDRYKRTLPPYKTIGGDFPLLWQGVHIEDISVISKFGEKNDLRTFWGKRKYSLARGLDFERDPEESPPVPLCITHLDHEAFQYQLVIDRKSCAASMSDRATVRIFLAPRYNEWGKRFSMEEQRRLFFHLDAFTVHLNVGRNIITRWSTDSSLTSPWTKSLQELQSGTNSSLYCGCGWPHHLLLPKGSPSGMLFDLFAMVTNGDEDKVDDHYGNHPKQSCRSAPIFCGVPHRKYPDARPMGYPFDRATYKVCPSGKSISSFLCHWFTPISWRTTSNLEDFMHGITNMASTKVRITHLDRFL